MRPDHRGQESHGHGRDRDGQPDEGGVTASLFLSPTVAPASMLVPIERLDGAAAVGKCARTR